MIAFLEDFEEKLHFGRGKDISVDAVIFDDISDIIKSNFDYKHDKTHLGKLTFEVAL